MIKRRTADSGKTRRPFKQLKKSENIYNNTLLYLKFFLIWGLVILADFLLEFRFEYLWSFWLLLTSVCDSYKYQGIAFSIFFVCLVLTSDLLCLIFLPGEWLFFLASTYVWVQFVWQTEKGICVSTLVLGALFVYIEAAVRLKESLKGVLPVPFDLCRPFAAHSIGYPMVTLGFGVKSYISYRFRLRRQHEISNHNKFYYQLLKQALPPNLQIEETEDEDRKEKLPNGISHNHTTVQLTTTITSITTTTPAMTVVSNGVFGTVLSHKESNRHHSGNSTSSNTIVSCHSASGDTSSSLRLRKNNTVPSCGEKTINNNHISATSAVISNGNVTTTFSSSKSCHQRRAKVQQTTVESKQRDSSVSLQQHNSPEEISYKKMEEELKIVRADLTASKLCEQELKTQLTSKINSEKSTKAELERLRQEQESMQSRLQNVTNERNTQKQTIASLEKKLEQERKSRATLERQLQEEKTRKKSEDSKSDPKRSENLEQSLKRIKELETEMKQAATEASNRESTTKRLELQIQSFQQRETEFLREKEHLNAMVTDLASQKKRLDSKLKNEDKLKCELFSALSESKHRLEITQSILLEKDKIIATLQQRYSEHINQQPPHQIAAGYPYLTSTHMLTDPDSYFTGPPSTE